ncbi:disulfide bond formation protein B [Aminobacter anthyllidis]|uniref:Disulfide bond formation protein B n=1 Tax=Aminobacter anthyllidis TaxID=1035067 RepID=A0A9X1AA53_9HYPH|nr:disulfide bond formation protein B [Aminobacter anthyllidis]MBT1155861.1 disulfide bond formation protein B [Aminobacter anthyllidis]
MTVNADPQKERAWGPLLVAWLIALSSTLSALFIGEIMGQAPCVLCWFQRAFMFPLAIILAVACFVSDSTIWRYALPLAVIGWLIALYHSLLYGGIIPESIEPCSAGPSCSGSNMDIFGWVPLPVLSLAAFTAITILLVIVRRRSIA